MPTSPEALPPRKRDSLGAWLAALIAVALLPVAMLSAWQVYDGLRDRQAALDASLARSAAGFAQSVDREVRSSIDALTVLSHSELFREDRIRTLGRLLQGRPRRDWESIFVLDKSGAVVVDTAAPRTAANDAQRLKELHQRVSAKLAPVLAGLPAGQTPGPRAIALALPVIHGGQLRYVLGARMTDSVWQRLAANAARPEGAVALLFDEQQRVIGMSSPAGEQVQEVYAANDTVPLAGWRVRIEVPAAPIEAQRRQAILHALSTTGASLLAGAALAALVALRIVRRGRSADSR